ncbi:DUF5995 family protein [Streptomyces sp. NPDC056734]|uniref:DUF5995 family protein n=1 Tax=Streptomyces sp. NPDC056734 TaxID=3345931 RepID=UPI00367E3E05
MAPLEHLTTPVGTVVARMRTLDATLPARDGVAVFNRVYLAATQAVHGDIGTGRFTDPGAATTRDIRPTDPGTATTLDIRPTDPGTATTLDIRPTDPGTATTLDIRRADPRGAATLAVRLTERYLTAVDAAAQGHRPPACWRPLFQLRRHPGVRPLQFALAGVNAHIGHDLALAVVDACRTLDCAPAGLEDEFDRVGALLAALEERVREDLMPGPDLLRIADPLTHLLGAWSLERALDSAWAAARALWGLRALPDVAGEFTDRLDAAVGFAGRMMLTPLPG